MTRDEIIAANSIEGFIRDRGHALKSAGQTFVTSGCPKRKHQCSHHPVMIYRQQQKWYCHDCKIGGTVIDWVMQEKGCDAAEAMQLLGGGRNGHREPVNVYDYTDEHGKLLYQVVRFEPKDFRQRKPDGKGGWIYNMHGVERVLYRLPEVIEVQDVCVTEREKDADNLAKLGFVSTTNCGGKKQWRDDYSETLRGKNVVIFGDNDKGGREHVEQVIASLTGIARSIKRVKLPEGFKDVSDYIAAQPKGAAKKAITKLIQETPELNSFNSFVPADEEEVVDDFPEPPSDIVFYGLAGEILRRIEPHTEADPVALLIQFLIAFANVIGRGAWATADGARHFFNLLAVLVGLSSKARKGTSLSHVLRVFERVDEIWRRNCTVSGLSSGEGLIYAVRDPIVGAKKGKQVVIDSGVSDKRLFVPEGEFANVLKVMAREGNTLSPVIRSAWDNGDLRTLTKNNPARATGAHISIIGHITREELRRHLTETEQGNGFANRFLWLAVKRSKCLPEGGNIESENFNDVVTRLHTAIEFGRNAGEVTRSDEARELWRIVYPELSEGKAGLLGAITARAEAQVLRLSSIYALLDCSTGIRPEHHRAALALWKYCDRSAKWIFGNATGNPHADKILIALRVAGSTGMTQTEINERVFNRNLSSYDLSAALRILNQSGQVKFTKESTGGAPRKRWFIA